MEADSPKAVVYFTASWCPPCKRIAPIFESLSKEFSGITFAKVDVDNVPEAASANFVRSVPTFQFRVGKQVLTEVNDLVLSTISGFKSCSLYVISFPEQMSNFCDPI